MNGIITISDKAIIQLAAHIAVKKTDGVRALADRSGRVPRRYRYDTGVYLSRTKQGLEIEICIVCAYGANTIKICNAVTNGIKTEIGELCKVNRVNVRVVGVQN